MNDSMEEDTLHSSSSASNIRVEQKKLLYFGLLGSAITSIGYIAALAYYLAALPVGYFIVNGYIFHFSFVYGLFIPISAPLLAAGYYGLSKKYRRELLRFAAGIMALAFVLSIFGTIGLIAWLNVPTFALWHFFVIELTMLNSILVGIAFYRIHEQVFSPRTVRAYVFLLIGCVTYFIFMQFFNFGSLNNPMLILFVVIYHSVNVVLGILAAYIFHGESRTPSIDD